MPGSRSSLPVFGFVRSSTTGLPTAAATSADGTQQCAFSILLDDPAGNPVTIALAGFDPVGHAFEAQPALPAGSRTVRVSLTRAKPSS